jgi:hypothetical protein
MSSEAEPFSATVYQESDGTWWVRITDDQGNSEARGPLAWDGAGRFYEQGLNAVVVHLPAGYGYKSWQDANDGTYIASLYRKWPGF